MANQLAWCSQGLVAPAITIVQSKWSRGVSSTQAVTLSNVSSGNLIVVVALVPGDGTTGIAAGTMSDGVGSYALDISQNANLPGLHILNGVWSRVAGSTGSLTITASPTGLIFAIDMCAYEIANLATSAFDSGNSALGFSGTASATPTTATFNTASAGVIVAIGGEGSGNPNNHTAGTNFSISDSGNANESDNSSFQSGCAEHRITSGALTGTSASFTIGTAQAYAILAAAYK